MVGYDWELSALHAILRGISSLTGTVQFSRLVSSFDAAQDESADSDEEEDWGGSAKMANF